MANQSTFIFKGSQQAEQRLPATCLIDMPQRQIPKQTYSFDAQISDRLGQMPADAVIGSPGPQHYH
jgi:hypothetical protein